MQNERTHKRRDFLKKATAFGAAAAFAPQFLEATPHQNFERKGGEGFTFLFQGDSITDGNRTRNTDWNHVMGHGYQFIIASKLWCDFPRKEFHFFNRGISGNKVTDLAARWKADTLDLKPDVLSILIGVNDASAFINGNKNFAAEQYEIDYRSLLTQTKQQLPSIQLILCEPFVLPVGNVKSKWELYSAEVQKRQLTVKQLSKEFDAIFVPFQSAFNNALSKAPAEYWIWDGIHPMPAGHELMAREWLQHVSKRLKFIR
jgi:lysophospholipase L1-like esterase